MNIVEQAYADYQKLKESIGFKREPALVNFDGGMSFMGFLSFASGESDEADELKRQFEAENGAFPGVKQAMADYVDWMIVNVWGEAGAEKEASNAVREVGNA